MAQVLPAAAAASRPLFPRRVRHTVLTLHVILSVAWIGMNLCLLILAVAGLSTDPQQARSAYFGMGLIGKTLILPISLGALITGIVLSFGTRWGLFQHYWVIAKLAMTLALVGGHQALRFRLQQVSLSSEDLAGAESPRVLGMLVGTLVVLVAATALSVFKPAGRSPWASGPPRARPVDHSGFGLPW